jgi:hypothetical protein
MTTTDLAGTGLESRLRDFLSAAAPRLRPARDTASERIARLDAFLAAAHPYLHRGSPTPLRRVDPTRLGEVLRQLREPLERQRAEGRALNVWSVAGLKRDEVRNTAVLAELLRHERLGDVARAFLAAIVERARAGVPEFPVIDPFGAYRVSTEVCPLGQRNTRVDLVIETDAHLLGIEVKIGAVEGLDQLARYAAALSDRAAQDGKMAALVYLSGWPPAVLPEHAAHITWRDVHQAARQTARQHRTSTRASWLLTDFADHIAALR